MNISGRPYCSAICAKDRFETMCERRYCYQLTFVEEGKLTVAGPGPNAGYSSCKRVMTAAAVYQHIPYVKAYLIARLRRVLVSHYREQLLLDYISSPSSLLYPQHGLMSG